MPNDTVSADAAPPNAFFEDILNRVRLGKATCGSLKEKQGTYCLSGAMIVDQQNAVMRCTKLALCRDESLGRLHCNIKGVEKGLKVYRGYLGSVRDRGQSSSAVTEATAIVMRNAATRFLEARQRQDSKFAPEKASEALPRCLELRCR